MLRTHNIISYEAKGVLSFNIKSFFKHSSKKTYCILPNKKILIQKSFLFTFQTLFYISEVTTKGRTKKQDDSSETLTQKKWTKKSKKMVFIVKNSLLTLTMLTTLVLVLNTVASEYISNLDVDLHNPTYEDMLKQGRREQELHRMRQRRQVRKFQ